MAINLQSLSLTSAFSSIVNFFRSQENNSKWRDLTVGSEGSFLIRLLANIFSTLSYRIVAQSRENYLSTAALPSSNIGISVNLGYSAFRGSNLKRLIEIVPNGDYTLPKLSQIGSYNDNYDIYVYGYENSEEMEDVHLEAGKAVKLKTVIGNAKEETIVAGTSAIKCFTLFTTGISEDYTLFLGSQEVPTTDVIKKMTEDKYLVRTNPYSSVDIMYLNTFPGAKYTYGIDSEITIRYIELADVPVFNYTDAMFPYGTLLNYRNISTYLPFESVESMKINAPLDHETQNLIRSKQDYANRMQQIVPAVISSDYYAVTPTYTQITYLKNDFTLLSDDEEGQVEVLLKEENYFGTPLPDIVHPRREVALLRISIALTNKYKNISDINLDIENILESFYDARLGATFNTFDLERKIEALSYVKYARVSHVAEDREIMKAYQVGYVVTHDSNTYMASKILGLAGDVAPNWNVPIDKNSVGSEIDTGLLTKDGSLVWRTYKKLPNMPSGNFELRQNTMPYGIGDFVYDPAYPDFMFKCVDIVKSSGFTEPDLSEAEAGDFFVDGNIVWVAKEYSSTYGTWSPSTTYSLKDSVNVSTSSTFSLECVSYTGVTGTNRNLVFEQSEYPVSGQTINTFEIKGDCAFYFKPGDYIAAEYRGGTKYFYVISGTYNDEDNNTIVTVSTEIDLSIQFLRLRAPERGTKDGQILWKLVEDTTNIKYPWNGYVVFNHTLEIIE